MRKNFIIDTNVLLYDPQCLTGFGENTVVIPIEVVEELDGFKRDATELGRNSRAVSMALDEFSQNGRLGEGVRLTNGGLLRIAPGVGDNFVGEHGLDLDAKVGNRILNLAAYLNAQYPQQPSIIVTKNTNLRLKADALGIYAEDYETGGDDSNRQIRGYAERMVSAETIEELRTGGSIESPNGDDDAPNEYFLLSSVDDNRDVIPTKVGTDGRLHIIQTLEHGVCSIEPRNAQQVFALDALLNDDIKLVTLVGRAGTGKTLLAVAAGLHKVIHESLYSRLLISRPTMPMGRDIGFIPGDIEEKLRPWMQPVYDAVEMIREQDRRSRQRTLPRDLLESGDVGIEPLTHIRGRSIPHQFFVIDEAQNLTPHEVKTIITRVGYNTKIVLTGDPEQIDTPYVDLRSNGLTFLVERFRSQTISAHVTLTKGERSELAEIAANIL